MLFYPCVPVRKHFSLQICQQLHVIIAVIEILMHFLLRYTI